MKGHAMTVGSNVSFGNGSTGSCYCEVGATRLGSSSSSWKNCFIAATPAGYERAFDSPGECLPNDNESRNLGPGTVDECAAHCTSDSRCVAFDFDYGDGGCYTTPECESKDTDHYIAWKKLVVESPTEVVESPTEDTWEPACTIFMTGKKYTGSHKWLGLDKGHQGCYKAVQNDDECNAGLPFMYVD